MNCFYHPDTVAVGTCKNCSRGLCRGCAADVGNGLACRSRCEGEVGALNRIIAQNKSAYEKAGSAYTRTAIFYALVGGAMLVTGSRDWRGFGWVLVPAGAIFLAAALLYYTTGAKYRRES